MGDFTNLGPRIDFDTVLEYRLTLIQPYIAICKVRASSIL